MPYIGARIKRKEDVRLLRGIGKYVGDIHRVGMVHAAIVRSTHAHARIVNIDTAAALRLPGVRVFGLGEPPRRGVILEADERERGQYETRPGGR